MNLIETSTAERVLALAREVRLDRMALLNMIRAKDQRIAELEYILAQKEGRA